MSMSLLRAFEFDPELGMEMKDIVAVTFDVEDEIASHIAQFADV